MPVKQRTVLHVIWSLLNGGTEKYLVNLLKATRKDYRNIVVYYGDSNEWATEFAELNIKVINLKSSNNFNEINSLRRIMREYDVDIVYAYTHFNSAVVLLSALLAGVKKRIVHSHIVKPSKKVNSIKVRVSKFLIRLLATERLACSKQAGLALFGSSNFTVVNNGIDLSLYEFDSVKRQEIRKELEIDGRGKLLGTVGRLDDNKNQKFMIEILSCLKMRNEDYSLVVVGDGNNLDALRRFASEKSVGDAVQFIGCVKNVQDYYNAFDAFLLTSFNEGLPFVLIEAQANGLPVFASSSIAREAKINSNFQFMDLNDGARRWADAIINYQLKRVKPNHKINDYSIQKTVKIVKEIYEKAK